MGASKSGHRSSPGSPSELAPQLSVDVIHHSPEWEDVVEDSLLVRAAVAACRAGVGKTPEAELALLLAADDEVRALNKKWRGKDEATNVLSFPLDAPQCSKAPRSLGDVAMAFETVKREAGERDIPVSQHAAHLVVHGVLHLLGYTHETDSRARKMEALEVRVLESLELPDPYALDAMTTGEEL